MPPAVPAPDSTPYDLIAGSAAESRRLRAFLRIQQRSSNPRRTINATPPRVPPTIAPVLLELLDPELEFDVSPALPPADPPPTPPEAEAVADALVEVDDVVADAGLVLFMQLVPPLWTVRSEVDPPVWYGPLSAIRRRNCDAAAMSTIQS